MILHLEARGRAAIAAFGAATTLMGCQSLPPAELGAAPAVSEPQPRLSHGVRPAIASGGAADVGSLNDEQIAAMFDAALEQVGPGHDKAAACVGMQGANDAEMKDAPAVLIGRLSERLGLPAVPASRCGFDHAPFVIGSDDDAILFTVSVGPRDTKGVVSFRATVAYGNLGATSLEFRLVRQRGNWAAQPTGRGAVS